MREIKFRCWNSKLEKMVNVARIDIADGFRKNTIFGEDDFLDYWNDDKLMQYTGLHDKNGREIYEGDIVAIDCFVDNSYYESWDINYPATERYDFQFRCSVIWVEETGGFGLEVEMCNLCKKARDKYDEDIENEMAEIRSGYFEWNELEVVGNIYENPELLEEQS